MLRHVRVWWSHPMNHQFRTQSLSPRIGVPWLADIHTYIMYIDIFKGMMILLITSGTFWSTSIGFPSYGVSSPMITGGSEYYQWLSLKVLHALSSFWERSHLRERWRDGVWHMCFSFLFWIRNVIWYYMIRHGMIWLIPINHYGCW